MVSAKKGVLKSRTGAVAAILDEYAPVLLNGDIFSQTVRTSTCELLTNGVKCQPSTTYRVKLRAMYSRMNSCKSASLSATTSHVNERYLNTPEKNARMENMKKRVHAAESEVQISFRRQQRNGGKLLITLYTLI